MTSGTIVRFDQKQNKKYIGQILFFFIKSYRTFSKEIRKEVWNFLLPLTTNKELANNYEKQITIISIFVVCERKWQYKSVLKRTCFNSIFFLRFCLNIAWKIPSWTQGIEMGYSFPMLPVSLGFQFFIVSSVFPLRKKPFWNMKRSIFQTVWPIWVFQNLLHNVKGFSLSLQI